MATADFYNRSGALLGLPLNLLNDITQYADFHKRSETSPSDFSIDEFDMPFLTMTDRNGNVLNLTLPGGGDTGTGFIQGFAVSSEIPHAVVTPSVSDDPKYSFSNNLTFNNSRTESTFVVLYAGTIPPGLTLDTGLTDLSFVTFSGNVRDELFGITLNEYADLSSLYIQNQQTVILELEYIDNLTDKNVLNNPTETYSVGDMLINIGDGGSESRKIESIIRYIESSATETTSGNFVNGTEYYITVIGTTDFTEIGANVNEVGEIFTASGAGDGNGKASSEIKTKIYVKTYIEKIINNGGVQAVLADRFNLSQQRRFNVYTAEELPLDNSWRGYVKSNDEIYAQYTDVQYENSQDGRFTKTYTFTLRLYTDSTLTTFLEEKTFSVAVQASREALRNNSVSGAGISPARYVNFNEV